MRSVATGESVYYLERLRTASGIPVALERSRFHSEAFLP